MLYITNNNDISYTLNDTFEFFATPDSAVEADTQIKFCIAKNQNDKNLIEKTYTATDNTFLIYLDTEDIDKLSIGSYIYKLTIIDVRGIIDTRISGELRVKWGV
jgi:hypothetical protein